MSSRPVNAEYRSFVEQLRRVIDRRAGDERDFAAARDASDTPGPKQLEQTLQEIHRAFAASREYAEDQYRLQAAAIEAYYADETERIEAEFRHQTESIRAEYEQRTRQTEEEYQQNRWLMSSLVDDASEDSPKRKLELLRERLHQSTLRMELDSQGLDDQLVAAEAILASRGQSAEPPPVERVPPPRGSIEAVQRFTEAEEAARGHFERLKRQYVAQALSGTRLLLLSLALAAGIAAIAIFLVDRAAIGLGTLQDEVWWMISGGTGAIIALVAGLWCWSWSGRRTRDAYEAFYRSCAAARQCRQIFEAAAARELQDAEERYEAYCRQSVQHRERSLQRFSSERQMTAQQLIDRRDELLLEVEQIRAEALEPLDAARDRDAKTVSDHFAAYLATIERLRTVAEQRATHEFRARIDRLHADFSALWQELSRQWFDGWRELEERAAAWRDESDSLPVAWESILKRDWDVPETIPDGLRLGRYALDLRDFEQGLSAEPSLAPAETRLELPALLPFPSAPSLVVHTDAEGRPEGEAVLQTAMLRYLTSLPPGTVRFTVIDPQTLGEPFSAFMHLADFNELLISHRIWTEPAQIDRQLADLTEHMENIFQKYLRNEFASIEDYNREAGEVAEPYRVLVVAGFPHAFSERAAQRLASIAASGPRCGVYLLLGVDTTQPLPRSFDLGAIDRHATVLRRRGGVFRNEADGPPGLQLVLDPPPPPAIFSQIVRKLGELSLTTRRVAVPFQRIAPKSEEIWTADSRQLIDVPLGRAGATKLQSLRLGVGTSQHVLIAGRTGSGKSTLLHVIVTNAALHYSPNDLEFYLIDFKKGVEFKTYAAQQLPHARVIAVESDREFGVSALERLDAELKRRGDLFRRAGVQDLEAFRNAHPGEPLPRILLVIDEFQEFFVEDDRLSQSAALLLDRLVRQGRAFGIHVLLGSQTLGGAYSLARTTLGQMAVRIALQCSDADAHLILSEENTAARLLTRPGEAIYNDANGMVEGNSPFQISWLGDAEREQALKTLRRKADDLGLDTPPPIVFEGNIPADLRTSGELLSQLESGGSPAAPVDAPIELWLGDPVSIGATTSVELRRQPANHLLIVGQDAETSRGLLAASLLAAASSSPDGAAALYLFDGEGVERRASPRWQALFDGLAGTPHAGGPLDSADLLNELAQIVEERTASPAEKHPPVVVVIDDLTRFRELRKSDDDFGFGGFGAKKEVSPAQRFAELLKHGPAVGVHVVVWCGSYGNVDRWLGRALLREFDTRVALQMNATDSSQLIDSPAANRLGQNRALLYRDSQGTIEKFRPYGFPDADWLRNLRHNAGGPEVPSDIEGFQIL